MHLDPTQQEGRKKFVNKNMGLSLGSEPSIVITGDLRMSPKAGQVSLDQVSVTIYGLRLQPKGKQWRFSLSLQCEYRLLIFYFFPL